MRYLERTATQIGVAFFYGELDFGIRECTVLFFRCLRLRALFNAFFNLAMNASELENCVRLLRSFTIQYIWQHSCLRGCLAMRALYDMQVSSPATRQ